MGKQAKNTCEFCSPNTFYIMATRNFFSALAIIALFSSLFACVKPSDEAIKQDPIDPTIPTGSRIQIHFGTSTQRGCLYSFSNCIWIGWGHATELQSDAYALQFDNGDEVGEQYGQFFPLTADVTLESVAGQAPQTLPSGFYRFGITPDGRRNIRFSPDNLQPVASVCNPNNPQDNLGQLHNLAMQAILTPETRDEFRTVDYDMALGKKMLTEKTVQFLHNEADVTIGAGEQRQIEQSGFDDNYGEHRAWLASSGLSDRDRNTLADILDMASAMPVESPEQLSAFVQAMTEAENRLVENAASLDNDHLLLSAVSVAKHSRYFWFWKTYTTQTVATRADWWKADVRGLVMGGIGQALVDSLVAALKK